MISLILDSSFKHLNVGVKTDNNFYKISYEAFQKQSEYMISEINNIFINNNLNFDDVSEIIVTIGPGSYTGLRIALTIAKVYAHLVKCPVYTVSSLQMLANLNKASICLMNARSNRSFIGIYDKENTILKDQILTNDEVSNILLKYPEYEICGDVEYLNINSTFNADLLENIYKLKNESNKVTDIFSLKALYLKD